MRLVLFPGSSRGWTHATPASGPGTRTPTRREPQPAPRSPSTRASSPRSRRGQRTHRGRTPNARGRAPGPARRGQRRHRRTSSGGTRRCRRRSSCGTWRHRILCGGRGGPCRRARHRTIRRPGCGAAGSVGIDDGRSGTMSLLANIVFVMAEGEPHRDDNGQIVTHSWIWPEKAELIYGTIASIIIFALLWKFAGPAIVKGFNARTERIQGRARRRRHGTGRGRCRGRAHPQPPRATSTPSASACSPRPTLRPRRCWPTAEPASSKRSPSSKHAPTPTSRRWVDAPATSCAPRSHASHPRRPIASSPAGSTATPSKL